MHNTIGSTQHESCLWNYCKERKFAHLQCTKQQFKATSGTTKYANYIRWNCLLIDIWDGWLSVWLLVCI